jgi:large subunit ribosomal protein L6e
MAKGDAKRKESRKKNAEENKGLKLKKNWYPVADSKKHFLRKCKAPKKSHISAELKPGQVVILLSGRFRGRRVVFLKKLESNLLLVTGPYKYNGVPLKRVNAAYVLPTNTVLKVGGEVAKSVNDDLFKKIDIERKSEKDFFVEDKVKKERVSEDRKKAQNEVDTEVKKAVDEVPMMKEYLRNRFALKSGDKPHLMKF